MHLKKIFIFISIALLLAGCATQGIYLKLDPSLNRDIKTFAGIQYVPLVKMCDVYDIKCDWDIYTRTAVLKKNGSIVLRTGSPNILVNGSEKRMSAAALLNGGVAFVPLSFVRTYLGYITAEPSRERAKISQRAPAMTAPRQFEIKTIVVDAGHGGKDAGAVGRRLRLKEKNLALSAAKKLKKLLEAEGIKVILTRDDDTFISLPRRARIANESNADLFVSVHINASKSRVMRGFECYYLSDATDDQARALEAVENASLKLSDDAALEHSKGLDATLWDMALSENRRESAELASRICASVDSSLMMKNRGIKTARFYVLKYTRMPSVLVEIGYISNKYEEMKLKDPKYVDRMAEAVARGILVYKDKYEKTEGFTSI
ncbi:MAG: N-acetylmuramoyl-L-alanine amidase [Candidatus Omnitrophica bacterium]|nr:N-acetylmuramoyl-L-alanine amidase [Candidatus Omnitrophota bacterium]